GITAFHNASLNGHMDVVKLLLEKGADHTVANKAGCIPLLSAAKTGHKSRGGTSSQQRTYTTQYERYQGSYYIIMGC
ncbi:hypothetical protein BKA67DRAFT_514491, partial [Truncatella angustata]